MEMTLQEQRNEIDKASRFLDKKIKDLTSKRDILVNAFNSIDQNRENILDSQSILAQETRKIMCEINYLQ